MHTALQAYSGDYGLGFFGSSLEASATLARDPSLGTICYLCDLETVSVGGATASKFTIRPRDAYRQRVFLEPLGVYLQADAGTFDVVALDLVARTIAVSFSSVSTTPAGVQTYDALRLRVDKTVVPPSARPGSNFRVLRPKGAVVRRDAFEVAPPTGGGAVTVVVGYDDDS